VESVHTDTIGAAVVGWNTAIDPHVLYVVSPTRETVMIRSLFRCCTALGVALLMLIAKPSLSRAQLVQSSSIAAEGAQRAIAAALAEARKNNWNVSIAVVDPHGEMVAFLRMDGASIASTDVSRSKARTAARFRRPTFAYDSTVKAGRIQVLALEGMTPVEGGVPITINGQVVGAIGVSGATSAQDAQMALAGAAAVQP
jgi:glc operon protein GlcG